MPGIQTIDLTQSYEKGEPSGLEKFFSKMGKDYREKQDRTELNSILSNYKENRENANALEDLYLNIQQSNKLSPTRRLEALDELGNMSKVITERDKTLNASATAYSAAEEKKKNKQRAEESVYELYKPHMPEEEARRLSKIDTEATARQKVSNLNKSEKDPYNESYERTSAAEDVKKLAKLEDDIPKAKDSLENLNRIESLIKNELSGVKGFAKAALNTEAAAEVSSLGLTAIEPILKLFNPVGAIPTQKINLIRSQFQIHPSDLQSTAQGKINALRRMATQGLARAEARVKLIREKKGKISPEVLKEFDDQSESLLDATADQEIFDLKFKDKKEDEIVSDLYSNEGRKLKPMTVKQAKNLYDQGLITNVKPS